MLSDLDCVKIFQKPELLEIAKELDIAVDISIPYSKTYNLIMNDIKEKGVPEIDDNISELLGAFLVTVGFIDEEGNLLDMESDGEEEIQKPPCWSFFSEYDPACQGCKVKGYCESARKANRPECFGRYDEQDDNCKQCLEMTECIKTQKAGNKKSN
jgi:hypothetical protein